MGNAAATPREVSHRVGRKERVLRKRRDFQVEGCEMLRCYDVLRKTRENRSDLHDRARHCEKRVLTTRKHILM